MATAPHFEQFLNITAILLAAGAGSRFGGDKLLHPMSDGVAIAAHAARNLNAAGLNVVAVVKSGDFPLADMLEQEGCYVTLCRDAARGMGVSLAHGVAECRGADGWIIALADMPSIKPDTITAVARKLEAGLDLVAPRIAVSAAIRLASASVSGRGYWLSPATPGHATSSPRRRASSVLIERDDAGILHDIDRREDLA
jgi:molybdenum cofactor cytidylyltransferase